MLANTGSALRRRAPKSTTVTSTSAAVFGPRDEAACGGFAERFGLDLAEGERQGADGHPRADSERGLDRLTHPCRARAQAWVANAHGGEHERAERREDVERLNHSRVAQRETEGEHNRRAEPDSGFEAGPAVGLRREGDCIDGHERDPAAEGESHRRVAEQCVAGEAEQDGGGQHAAGDAGCEGARAGGRGHGGAASGAIRRFAIKCTVHAEYFTTQSKIAQARPRSSHHG